MRTVCPSLMDILENIFGHMQPGSLKIVRTAAAIVHVQLLRGQLLLLSYIITIIVNLETLAIGNISGIPVTPCGMVRGVLQEVTAAVLVGCHGSVEHYLVRLQMTLRCMRLCCDGPLDDEDVAIEQLGIYTM